MYYPEEIIEEIRTENNIVQVISEYINLTKKGNSYFGLCPFHNEKTASFSVSEDKQMYYCFGCGAGGNVITFIMEKENYNFVETIQFLAKRGNIPLPEAEYSEEAKKEIQKKQQLLQIHNEAGRYFYYNLQEKTGNEVRKYLSKRNIQEAICKKFGLGYARASHYDLYQYLKKQNYSEDLILESGLVIKGKKPNRPYDRFSDRLMFPIFDVHGKVIAFGGRVLDGSQPKYLNSPESTLFEKNMNLYGLNYARTSREKELFIVEGYMDVIAMYQAGIKNVVATLGTAFTSGHAKLLKRYCNDVILLYDSDHAGIRATLRAIPILQSQGMKVRVLHLPGQQDPDDYISINGSEALLKLADEAVGAVGFQIKIIKEKYDIENVEQKIKFIDETAILIADLQNAVEQEIYMQEVAMKYKIDMDALKTEIRKKMSQKQARSSRFSQPVRETMEAKTKASNIQDTYFKTQSELLQLMSLYPKVLKWVQKHLSPEEFIDPFFEKLVSLIYTRHKDGYIENPSQFSNFFETLEEQKKVANIFLAQKKYENNEMIEKAVNDTVRKLKIKGIENRLKTTSDVKELQNLLQMKKETDKLYIGSISG